MEQRLRAALKAIQGTKIPDLPKEIMELDVALSSKFPNNQNIAQIIESNTKLSGDVLRIVNSPVMKLKKQVKTIREAVDTLGYVNLKNLVVSAALQNLFNTNQVKEIIEHCKEVAFCCAELSEVVQDVSRDEAYLAGLFHNGGALLLATKDPENYPKIFSQINTSPKAGIAKEEELYGSTHADVGILLGQKWKLPVEMLNVIMRHHADVSAISQDKVRSLVAILKIANFIVNEVSYGAYITNEARTDVAQAQEELMLTGKEVGAVRKVFLSNS